MADDRYFTIKHPSESKYTEKMSRFLGFAEPVKTSDEARAVIKSYQNKYHDARHVCWAYMIGPHRTEWQLNDNGEPSGTAGKPILGQINSAGITNVVICVVRYFGGIKLGTSGLISAYREAARLAIENGEIIECHRMEQISVTFPYIAMNDVMKIIKGSEASVDSRDFGNTCTIVLSVRADKAPELIDRLSATDGTSVESTPLDS